MDLVFAANVMHFVDAAAALCAFDWQLRPGGTLAIALFGLSALRDERAQGVWERLIQRGAANAILIPRRNVVPRLKMVSVGVTEYDAVPLPAEVFRKGAVRYKVNFPEGWRWRRSQIAPECDDLVQKTSEVGEDDQAVYENGEAWDLEADLDVIKEQAATFPVFHPLKDEDLWKEMAEAFDSRKIKGVWPSV